MTFFPHLIPFTSILITSSLLPFISPFFYVPCLPLWADSRSITLSFNVARKKERCRDEREKMFHSFRIRLLYLSVDTCAPPCTHTHTRTQTDRQSEPVCMQPEVMNRASDVMWLLLDKDNPAYLCVCVYVCVCVCVCVCAHAHDLLVFKCVCVCELAKPCVNVQKPCGR